MVVINVAEAELRLWQALSGKTCGPRHVRVAFGDKLIKRLHVHNKDWNLVGQLILIVECMDKSVLLWLLKNLIFPYQTIHKVA